MKQDKFLTGILIGVGALVVLALVLFFTRQDKRDYLPEDTPEGVAHNYVLRADGRLEPMGHIGRAELDAGDCFVIETPGGGGFGAV